MRGHAGRGRPRGGGNPNRQMEEKRKGDCAAGGGAVATAAAVMTTGGDEAVNMALICMGRLKERYWRDAADEYDGCLASADLKSSWQTCRNRQTAHPPSKRRFVSGRAEPSCKKVREGDIVIALCIGGKQLDSVQLSQALTLRRYGQARGVYHRRFARAFSAGHRAGRFQARFRR